MFSVIYRIFVLLFRGGRARRPLARFGTAEKKNGAERVTTLTHHFFVFLQLSAVHDAEGLHVPAGGVPDLVHLRDTPQGRFDFVRVRPPKRTNGMGMTCNCYCCHVFVYRKNVPIVLRVQVSWKHSWTNFTPSYTRERDQAAVVVAGQRRASSAHVCRRENGTAPGNAR